MDSSAIAHDHHSCQQALSIHLLESEHRSSLALEDIIHKEEDSRRLHVRLLIQQEENEDLQDRLVIEDDRIYGLEASKADILAQLEQTEAVLHQFQSDLRAKGRETDTLKTELASMIGLSRDSNKLLAEKLELARELASIKPELDHLRSQASYQQSILSEKLSLKRQLSTVELELEAAKAAATTQELAKGTTSKKEAELQKQLGDLKRELGREKQEREQAQTAAERELEAAKTAASKKGNVKGVSSKKEAQFEKQLEDLKRELAWEKQQREQIQTAAEREVEAAKTEASKQAARVVTSKEEAEFEKQLEYLKMEVAREKKEREQIQSAAQRDAKEWESKRTILEGKVEAMRTKLRSTKEELNEVQASLAHTIAQASKPRVPTGFPELQNKSRKRSALSILDNTIGTPDGIAVRGKRGGQKRGKLDQTSLGEKSMFSVTPYLNKTTNALLDTPKDTEQPAEGMDEAQERDDDNHQQGGAILAAGEAAADPSPLVSRIRPDSKPGKKPTVKKPKASSKKDTGAAKKSGKESHLERVQEEPEMNEPSASMEEMAAPLPAVSKPILNVPSLTAKAPEPKKKKRKILGTSKTIFDEEDAEATKRPAKMLLATNRPLARLAGKKNLTSAPAEQFAAFSPLKKDKRGVQASFLG